MNVRSCVVLPNVFGGILFWLAVSFILLRYFR